MFRHFVQFCDFLFALHIQASFKKELTLNGKNLLPIGSKFFPFRLDSFLELTPLGAFFLEELTPF